jgi:hypothetical protein
MLNLKIRCFVRIYSLESFISVVNNTNANFVGFIYLAFFHFERSCLLSVGSWFLLEL